MMMQLGLRLSVMQRACLELASFSRMLSFQAKENFRGTVPAPLWASPHVTHSISYVTC